MKAINLCNTPLDAHVQQPSKIAVTLEKKKEFPALSWA